MTRLRNRLVERLRSCDAKMEGGDRAGWSSLLPTTTPREEETEEVEDDVAAVREETMRTESVGYDAYGDDAVDVPVRSLSPRAEYEAALAVVNAQTMPASLPPAPADRGQSIPTFEDDEHAVRVHDEGAPRDEPQMVNVTAVTASIPFEANEESQAEMATMEAAPIGSDSERRRTTMTGSVSGRKRSRINETPSGAVPLEDATGRDTEGGEEGLLPASATGGKALRFSVDASLSLNDDDLLAAAEAHEATTRTVKVVPTSKSRYECALDVRVRDATCASVVFAQQRLGVVVQAKETKEWVDVLVFSMDQDENAPSKLVGTCVVHASDASGRRTSRRRSSLGAAASGAPDARAIRLSPAGTFVFAPGASDGVRILSVTFRDDENDDTNASDACLTSPSSTSAKKKSKRQKRAASSEVARLECNFKVQRAATWTRGDEFFLGAAGAEGRCVVWSWNTTNSRDDAFIRNEPSARVDFAPVLFRGVAPNPGSVTNLSWISSTKSTASPRLLGVIDDGLACVWNVEKKTCERVCFTADHRIERLLPVRYDGCEPTSDDVNANAPIPALALTHAKERKGPEMVSESSSSYGSDDLVVVKPLRVRAALVRAHGVSVGAPLFPDEALDSVATLDYDSTTACVGTHDGLLVIWDIDSGKILHEARIADEEDDGDENVSSVACRADSLVAATAGNRTRVFRHIHDASNVAKR